MRINKNRVDRTGASGRWLRVLTTMKKNEKMSRQEKISRQEKRKAHLERS